MSRLNFRMALRLRAWDRAVGSGRDLLSGISSVVASPVSGVGPFDVCGLHPHRNLLHLVGFSVLHHRLRHRMVMDCVVALVGPKTGAFLNGDASIVLEFFRQEKVLDFQDLMCYLLLSSIAWV